MYPLLHCAVDLPNEAARIPLSTRKESKDLPIELETVLDAEADSIILTALRRYEVQVSNPELAYKIAILCAQFEVGMRDSDFDHPPTLSMSNISIELSAAIKAVEGFADYIAAKDSGYLRIVLKACKEAGEDSELLDWLAVADRKKTAGFTMSREMIREGRRMHRGGHEAMTTDRSEAPTEDEIHLASHLLKLGSMMDLKKLDEARIPAELIAELRQSAVNAAVNEFIGKAVDALYKSGRNNDGDPCISVYWDGCSSESRNKDALRMVLRKAFDVPAPTILSRVKDARIELLESQLSAMILASELDTMTGRKIMMARAALYPRAAT